MEAAEFSSELGETIKESIEVAEPPRGHSVRGEQRLDRAAQLGIGSAERFQPLPLLDWNERRQLVKKRPD